MKFTYIALLPVNAWLEALYKVENIEMYSKQNNAHEKQTIYHIHTQASYHCHTIVCTYSTVKVYIKWERSSSDISK